MELQTSWKRTWLLVTVTTLLTTTLFTPGVDNTSAGGQEVGKVAAEGANAIIKEPTGAVVPVPGAPAPPAAPPTAKCQEITIPMCKGIGYNYTEMPNPFNHDSQEEAGMEVHQYWPLVEIRCSSDLKFFICSLYVPICMEDYVGIVPPCRSVCERAKYGCEPVMVQYGFPWPERMQCDRFPKYGKGNICMDERNGEPPPPPKVVPPTPAPGAPGGASGPGGGPSSGLPGGGGAGRAATIPLQPCKCSCKPPLVNVANFSSPGSGPTTAAGSYAHAYVTNGVPNCAIPCHGGYHTPEEIQFSTWWLSLWSGLCCFTTFVTLLTFLIDPDRFKYPERPIVYLSACYMMVSIGYLLRIWRGHDEVACNELGIVRYGVQVGRSYTEEPHAGNVWCVLVFLFIYYFGMASSIWWVILALTWYLAAGLKWSTEAITSHSHVFHIVCWVLPAIGALIAIIDGAIDGDAISGICSIGNQDSSRLMAYIVGPLGLLLVLGTGFLLAGFIALVRIRKVIASQGGGRSKSSTEKLEKLMIRIGVFSVLYTLPASAVIGAYFYETSAKALWLENVTCGCGRGSIVEKPLYSVLMLKYFMSLAVGITSGVWIWSGKTVESWQRFFHINSNNNGHQQLLHGGGSHLQAAKYEYEYGQQQLQSTSVAPAPPLPPPGVGPLHAHTHTAYSHSVGNGHGHNHVHAHAHAHAHAHSHNHGHGGSGGLGLGGAKCPSHV